MLTIETGDGSNPLADSYVSLAEVRAFAVSRGKTLPSSDDTLEQQIRTANDYIVHNESRFQGTRASDTQSLTFPRIGVSLNGRTLQSNVIPSTLKTAIFQLVIESQDTDALPTASGQRVVEESVGPLKTIYQNTGVLSVNPSFPKVDAYLYPLFRSGAGILSVSRV